MAKGPGRPRKHPAERRRSNVPPEKRKRRPPLSGAQEAKRKEAMQWQPPDSPQECQRQLSDLVERGVLPMPHRDKNERRMLASHFIGALRAARGLQTRAARLLRVNRETVRRAILEHEEVRTALQDILEEELDGAEHGLLRSIRREDPWAIKFYLSTKGKDRGFTTRQEVTGQDNTPLRARVDMSNITTEQLERLQRAVEDVKRGAAAGADADDGAG